MFMLEAVKFNIDLTDLIIFLLTALGSVITAYAIPWFKEKKLEKWVKFAVLAADQIYKGSSYNTVKKDYVLSFLKSKGFSINSDKIELTIDTLIEAAVKQLRVDEGNILETLGEETTEE